MKKALITGITGQDGSYLAELLLEKGYEVHGLKRRTSTSNTSRIDHITHKATEHNGIFTLHEGDLGDYGNMVRLLRQIEPDEIYNLAAQSHVGTSFESPEYTGEVNALGTLRLLESIRSLGLVGHTRFYQASTSELFGKVQEVPQTEKTPFYPRSPYACSKLFAYWMCVTYREAYGMYACNGILFNHESPRRGENFVTRKITRGLSRILLGLEKRISLGNMDARRDWGHARDYARMQWLMLQQNQPEDFVIATGKQISVRDFAMATAKAMGLALEFDGKGVEEKAFIKHIDKEYLKNRHNVSPEDVAIKEGDCIIDVSPRFFRQAEVETLLGNSDKAREKLGWKPHITLEEMIDEMVDADMTESRKSVLLKKVFSAN